MQSPVVSGMEKKESSNVCVAQSGINSNGVGSKLMCRGRSMCTYVLGDDRKCECCEGDAVNTKKGRKNESLFLFVVKVRPLFSKMNFYHVSTKHIPNNNKLGHL